MPNCEVYLRNEEQTQRDCHCQVRVGEEQQQHPVWMESVDQSEPVRRENRGEKSGFSGFLGSLGRL